MGRELKAELERIFPATLDAVTASAAVDEFERFLNLITRREHEAVLALLPEMPGLSTLPTEPLFTSLGVTTPRQLFFDSIIDPALQRYLAHVPATEVVDHLLDPSPNIVSLRIRRLLVAASPQVRTGLFDLFLEQELSEREDGGTVAVLEAALEQQVGYLRPGMVEDVIARSIAETDVRKAPPKHQVRVLFELHVLRILQKKRRAAATFATIDTSYDARFATEEAERELFFYPDSNRKRAQVLLYAIYEWFKKGVGRKTGGKVPLMVYGTFFDELLTTARALRGNWRFEERWRYYVGPRLRSDEFWQSIAGLHGDVPYDLTQAYRDEQAYRIGAVVGPAVLMGVVAAPVVVMIVIRAPGAAVQVVRWVSGRLLLGAQYAASMYRTYGFIMGTGVMAREAYTHYLVNAVTYNERLVIGAEVLLDIAGGDSGFVPGASPGDLASAAKDSVARLRRGVATAIDEGGQAIRFIEFAGDAPDGKLHHVLGEVISFENGKVKVIVRKMSPVVDDFASARRRIVFAESIDEGGTATTGRVAPAVRAVPSPPGPSSLLPAPEVTTIAGRQVSSWHADILVGVGGDTMRHDALRIVHAVPDHTLGRALVDGNFARGGTAVDWERDSRYLRAVSFTGEKTGGKPVVVLMSARHHERYLAAGADDPHVLDEVFDLGGVAVHKQTARDLVNEGWVDAGALGKSRAIYLKDLQLKVTRPQPGRKTGSPGTGNRGVPVSTTKPSPAASTGPAPGQPSKPAIPPPKSTRARKRPDPRYSPPMGEIERAFEQMVKKLDDLKDFNPAAIARIKAIDAETIRAAQIKPSDLAALGKSLARVGPVMKKFINEFHGVPGFENVLLTWAKRHVWVTHGKNGAVLKQSYWSKTMSLYEGTSNVIRYATARLDPNKIRFEWPASITDTSWGSEVFARYVDIVVEQGSAVAPGRRINMELKSWTLRTLENKKHSDRGGIGYQLIRDTALFDPDNIRWVFDAQKLLGKHEKRLANAHAVAKSRVVDAFMDIIMKDPFLASRWGLARGEKATAPPEAARVRALLEKVIEVH